MDEDMPPLTDEVPENELEAEASHTLLVTEDEPEGEVSDDDA